MADWNATLTDWLKPFVEKLGHKKRRQPFMCPLYVAGLIGPGERRSIEPIAARMAPDRYDRLHQFISDGLWDGAPLEAELSRGVARARAEAIDDRWQTETSGH
jgi:SRSO17 transposase